MRNRTLAKVLDKIFWFIVLLLPLIVYIFGNLSIGMVRDYQYADQTMETIASVFYNYFGYDQAGIVSDIVYWLGDNAESTLGYIQNCEPLVCYATYMIQVEIIHFMLDIILFMFKYARKLLDGVLV